VCWWRGRLPRCTKWGRRRETQDDRWKWLEHSDRHCGREHGPGRIRFRPLRLCAAIIGCRLRHLRSGSALFAMMQRTRAIPATLSTRLWCGLPAGTLHHRALPEGEQADNRGYASQERPHTLRMRCNLQPVKWHSRRITHHECRRNAPCK
jgi:hypothetical protein